MAQQHTLLREYRERQGLSCAEMAKKLGIAQSTLRSLENGTRTITPELSLDIETQTKGELTRAVLRPDIFGERAA